MDSPSDKAFWEELCDIPGSLDAAGVADEADRDEFDGDELFGIVCEDFDGMPGSENAAYVADEFDRDELVADSLPPSTRHMSPELKAWM